MSVFGSVLFRHWWVLCLFISTSLFLNVEKKEWILEREREREREIYKRKKKRKCVKKRCKKCRSIYLLTHTLYLPYASLSLSLSLPSLSLPIYLSIYLSIYLLTHTLCLSYTSPLSLSKLKNSILCENFSYNICCVSNNHFHYYR